MKQRHEGLILLELIVALTILGIGFAAAFAGISQSTRNIEKLQRVQQREAAVRNLFSELDLVRQLRAGDSTSGRFEDGTRWRIEILSFIPPTPQYTRSMVRITLRLEWDAKSGLQTKTIETYRLVETNLAPAPRSLEQQLAELQ
jgi:type II secretory pathway pseudopilin PulG